MAVYQIVVEGDEVLRLHAKQTDKVTPNIVKLLDNLRDTLLQSETGVGLAAPQIGISKRAIVISFADDYYELVNPIIVSKEGQDIDTEGCLSLPGIIGEVTRADKVTVKGLNRDGEEVTIKAEGYLARILQHEIDHLDGILFIDRAKNIRQAE